MMLGWHICCVMVTTSTCVTCFCKGCSRQALHQHDQGPAIMATRNCQRCCSDARCLHVTEADMCLHCTWALCCTEAPHSTD
jgi:hypothetical protein